MSGRGTSKASLELSSGGIYESSNETDDARYRDERPI